MLTGKYTVLEMTQTILEKMDSDEINSIFDTPESIAVAGEVRDTYWSWLAGLEDRQRKELIRLESLGDDQFFNQLKVPDNVVVAETVRYKIDHEWHTIPYVDPKVFLENSYNRSSHYTEVRAGKGNRAASLRVGTNEDPSCYTTFDNDIFIFDSVNTNIENTLQESKSGCWASVFPEFRLEDTFVPELRVDEFPGFLNDAIAACFIHFKGVSNSKSEKRARDQMVRSQNNRKRGRNRNVADYIENRGRGRHRYRPDQKRILQRNGGVVDPNANGNVSGEVEFYTTEDW